VSEDVDYGPSRVGRAIVIPSSARKSAKIALDKMNEESENAREKLKLLHGEL